MFLSSICDVLYVRFLCTLPFTIVSHDILISRLIILLFSDETGSLAQCIISEMIWSATFALEFFRYEFALGFLL